MRAPLPVLALLAVSITASADDPTAMYEVTITNVTKGQTFTPQLVVTHTPAVRLFTLGEPASPELAVLAEDGATGPLAALLAGSGAAVGDVQTIGGLLAPGASATITVKAERPSMLLSAAGMLIPTNDTFFALNGQKLPLLGTASYLVPAYDAGSEANDQNCANIPGPRCGGTGSSPGANQGDEGFVHIGNGFHELDANGAGGEILRPLQYDWRNPVALIVVRRVR